MYYYESGRLLCVHLQRRFQFVGVLEHAHVTIVLDGLLELLLVKAPFQNL